MIVVDDPAALDELAVVLDREAARLRKQGLGLTAADRDQRAARLRKRAAELRTRRTDGVRFG